MKKAIIKKYIDKETNIAEIIYRRRVLPFEEYAENIIDKDVVKIEVLSSSISMIELFNYLKSEQCILYKDAENYYPIKQNSILLRNNIILFNINEDLK